MHFYFPASVLGGTQHKSSGSQRERKRESRKRKSGSFVMKGSTVAHL